MEELHRQNVFWKEENIQKQLIVRVVHTLKVQTEIRNTITTFASKPLGQYTDLLLHDMQGLV
jgi:hypothetical protein